MFLIAALILGFSAAIAQVLILRELVTVLYGNELVFAVVLAGWLVGVGVGSSAFTFFRRFSTGAERTVLGLTGLAGILVPLTIVGARSLRSVLGIPPGMLVDILSASVASLVIVFPLSCVYGALFPALASCRSREGAATGAGRVYLMEALGFAVGGVVLTCFLLPTCSHIEIAFALFSIHVLLLTILSTRPFAVAAVAMVLTGVFLSGLPGRIDQVSRALLWQGFQVVESRDSVYGNVVLLQRSGQISLYENGLHVATTGDALSSEENVHYALLSHQAPQRVLLIGGGTAGALTEALKHPGVTVDYVELDPTAIGLTRRYIAETDRVLSDPRVRVVPADGRRFVKQATPASYDVVIVALGDPLSLLVNRYYTQEFLAETRRILTAHGILALSVTSSENYLNDEGRQYLRSIHKTMGQEFSEVRSIPGDRQIFLASPTPGSIAVDPGVWTQRLRERGIATKYVQEGYFRFRIDPSRLAESEAMLKGQAVVNTETRPATFLDAVVFWSTHFSAGFSKAVALFRSRGLVLILLPALLAGLAFLRRRHGLFISGMVVAAAGAAQMFWQLAVIMAFQSFYGYAYAALGLITSAFMLGAFLGGSYAHRAAGDLRLLLRNTVVGAAGFSLVLGWGLEGLSTVTTDALVLVVLALLPVGAGFLGGTQFVLASRISSSGETDGGVLYAWDLFGAAIGAILVGIFLIPLWGIGATASWFGLLQIAVLAAFWDQPAR